MRVGLNSLIQMTLIYRPTLPQIKEYLWSALNWNQRGDRLTMPDFGENVNVQVYMIRDC